MEQLLARLAELKAEGDVIMQQLMAAGMPPEQIMAAVEGGGQQMPQTLPEGMNIPGMGGRPGPDLPPGIPQGVPMPMNGGGQIPPGLLGGR